jgi:hypothetical protein
MSLLPEKFQMDIRCSQGKIILDFTNSLVIYKEKSETLAALLQPLTKSLDW